MFPRMFESLLTVIVKHCVAAIFPIRDSYLPCIKIKCVADVMSMHTNLNKTCLDKLQKIRAKGKHFSRVSVIVADIKTVLNNTLIRYVSPTLSKLRHYSMWKRYAVTYMSTVFNCSMSHWHVGQGLSTRLQLSRL